SFVLEAFFNIASMSKHTNENLWNTTTASGASLKKAFDTVYPFLTKQKEWSYPQIKPYDFEDAYFLLQAAAVQYNCKNCKEEIKELAGEKAGRLRLNLL